VAVSCCGDETKMGSIGVYIGGGGDHAIIGVVSRKRIKK
jgi:hypothetical protein